MLIMNLNNKYEAPESVDYSTVKTNLSIEVNTNEDKSLDNEYSKFMHTNTNKTDGGELKMQMIWQTIQSMRRQICIAGCLYLGCISDGYNVGWTAPVMTKLHDATETPLSYIISDTEASWVASIIFFGVFGSYLGGFLANIIGRKASLILGGIIMSIAYVVLILSSNVTMMYIGRFLVGVGQCWSTIVSLVYIGEMSSSKIRGTLLTLTGVFYNTGAILVYCVGPFSSYKVLNYVPLGFSLVFVFTSFFIPESPVYYILKGKEEEAKLCLKYLNRTEDIETELKRMVFKTQQKESKRLLWRQLFTKSNRHALIITVLMYFFQMNSGIGFFMFFSTSIFKSAGSSVEPYVATIIIGIMSLIGSLISPIFIDRLGRRLLLMISTGGCSICMMIMGVYFYLDKYDHSAISDLGWLPLLTMITAFIMYGIGLNNVPHTLNSEMYSPKVRGLGSSISYITSGISGLICITVSTYLMTYLGSHFTFWMFGVMTACALVFVALFIPETKGKTLTEIDDMMAN